jgi:multicomponent Na+:H+ antiporter subunit C
MGTETLFALTAAALVGIGLFGAVASAGLLRRVIGLNVMGCGIFLAFGVIARRGAGAGLAADPVPQALVITGLVVAFAATTLALALLRGLADGPSPSPAEQPAPQPRPGPATGTDGGGAGAGA